MDRYVAGEVESGNLKPAPGRRGTGPNKRAEGKHCSRGCRMDRFQGQQVPSISILIVDNSQVTYGREVTYSEQAEPYNTRLLLPPPPE